MRIKEYDCAFSGHIFRQSRVRNDGHRIEETQHMNFAKLAASALFLALGTASANAVSITFEEFTAAGFSAATENAVVEDFENATNQNRSFAGIPPRNLAGNQYGELDDFGYMSPLVGNFRSIGGVGTGTTCANLLDLGPAGCNQIALQYDPGINGQLNILPENGFWSLNSADTLGIRWRAQLQGGGLFNRLAFAIDDPADAGQKILDIFVDGALVLTRTNLPDAARWLAVIDFDTPVDLALIDIRTSERDGFTLDGASISAANIAPVPLPASGLLLLGGLGLMLVARRRTSA
ncbi:VPLPA-CTERM sorting domain-containing protein [Roseicyclus sp.]|uniref:VPLPA-CTERM sorting domain-containing protein n=1 Tax=Roseicyclus sp. TaxID=1914329 RepID=UPI003F9F738A